MADGATVTAIDREPNLLRNAKRRAPSAEFLVADILAFSPNRRYDQVIMSFLLHELDRPQREEVLRKVHTLVKERGGLAILEWGLPEKSWRSRLWRTFLRLFEPSSAMDVLNGFLETELVAAGWRTSGREKYAGGRAIALKTNSATDVRGCPHLLVTTATSS